MTLRTYLSKEHFVRDFTCPLVPIHLLCELESSNICRNIYDQRHVIPISLCGSLQIMYPPVPCLQPVSWICGPQAVSAMVICFIGATGCHTFHILASCERWMGMDVWGIIWSWGWLLLELHLDVTKLGTGRVSSRVSLGSRLDHKQRLNLSWDHNLAPSWNP